MADGKGKLMGLITDELSGRPLPGALIQIAGAEAHAVTGPDGRYTLSLAPNTYTVRVSLLGWNVRSDDVVVAADQTITQDFTLPPNALGLDALS